MLKSKNKLVATLFIVSLLFFTNLVRSQVIVDTSFLPRFLSLSLILLIAYLFLFRKAVLFEQNFWTISLFAFYLWNLLSCLWATSVSEAVVQSQLVFLGLAVFGIVSTYNRENPAFEGIFIRTHLLVLLFSYVLAFFKISTLTYYDPYKISSISLNNNLYSGFLLLSLPVILTAYSIFKGVWKYISVVSGILALFFMIIVQTRAVYMGLSFALIITSVLVVIKYARVFSKRNILTGFISLTVLFVSVFLFYSSLDATRRNAFKSKVAVWNYFIKQKAEEEVSKTVSEPIIIHTEPVTPSVNIPVEYFENVNTRLIFWKKSLGLIKTHLITGVGSGNWRIMIASVSEPPNPEHTIRNYTYSQPHNEWIGIISELGLVGFILAVFVFFVPIGIILFKVFFLRSKPPVSVIFYIGFLSGFYMYASFDFPFKRIEHIVLLFSVFAFVFSKMPLTLQNWPGTIFNSKLFPWIFTALLVFTAVIGVARLKGEFYTLKVFQNERRNDKAVIRYCHEAGNVFYKVTPNALPIDWFEGVANYRLGLNAAALHCFESAMVSTPYEVRVINDYAAVLFSLGKQAQAKGVLQNCLKIDPDFDDAKFNLGAMYYSGSQADSALIYINQCRESTKKQDYLDELLKSKLP